MIKNFFTFLKNSFYIIIGLIILFWTLGFLSQKIFERKITMSCKGEESNLKSRSEKVISLSITFINYPLIKPTAIIDSQWGDFYYDEKDESKSVIVFPHTLIAHSHYEDGRYTYFNLNRISGILSIKKSYEKGYDKRLDNRTQYILPDEFFEGTCENKNPI